MFKSVYLGTNWEKQNSIYIPHKVKTPHENLPAPMKCHIGRTLILQGCLCCASQSEGRMSLHPMLFALLFWAHIENVKKKQHIINKSWEKDLLSASLGRKALVLRWGERSWNSSRLNRGSFTVLRSAEKEWRARVSTFVLLIFEERHQPRSTVLFSRTSSFILLFSLFCSVPHSAKRTVSSCFLYLTFPPLRRLSSTPHSSLTLPRLPLQQQKSLPTRRG